MPPGPVVSTQLRSTGAMSVERRDEIAGQRLGNIDNVSTHDDSARQRRRSQRLMTVAADQRSNDVWFEPRQRSRHEYQQRADERCYYVPPVYSRAVHTRSGRRQPGQFATQHRDIQSDAGQTVDL